MIRFTTLFLSICYSQIVGAYSCVEGRSVDALFEDSDMALIGKIEKKKFELYFSKDKYLVTVNSLKKGKAAARHITVWTNRRGRCGAQFVEGKEFVIFLQEVDGKFWTDLNSAWVINKATDKHTQEYLNFEYLGSE